MAKDLNTKQLAKEMVKELKAETQTLAQAEMKMPADNNWEAISVEEKLERTRGYVKDLLRQVSYLRNQVNKFNRHSHNEKGEAIVVEKIGYGLGGGEEVSDTIGSSNYF